MRSLAARFLNYVIRVSLNTLGLQVVPASAFLESTREVSAILKATQHRLFLQYNNAVRSGVGLPSISDAGFRVYSQNDEDGILLFIFAVIGTTNKTFIEIGTGNGTECNCANLAINLGWHGLFIDGNRVDVEAGSKFYASHPDTFIYPPKFVCARVTRENINEILQRAGFSGEVDLLSIDIDGNDYWVWEAITCIHPRVVIIETRVAFGMRSIVVPYDPEYVYPGINADYVGASLPAMAKLANRLGYRLVGANRYGFNTVYVRKDIRADALPEVTIEGILVPQRDRVRDKAFDTIRHLPFVEV